MAYYFFNFPKATAGRLEPFGSNQLIGRFSTLSGHQAFNPKNAQEL